MFQFMVGDRRGDFGVIGVTRRLLLTQSYSHPCRLILPQFTAEYIDDISFETDLFSLRDRKAEIESRTALILAFECVLFREFIFSGGTQSASTTFYLKGFFRFGKNR